MRKQFLIYIFLLTSSLVSAQLYELGGFVGGSNYIGDLGPTYYINPNAMAYGGIAKFNYTSRITFRGTFMYTNLRMDDTKSNNEFRAERGLVKRNRILEAAAGIEFSFLKYSLSKVGYSHTPYIIAQAGVVNYRAITGQSANDPNLLISKRINALAIPFGLGYKMRLADNIGIAFETTFRYTFRDDIDENFYESNDPRFNFGNPDTDDWYVFTGISIVYAFGRPGCYKNNFF